MNKFIIFAQNSDYEILAKKNIGEENIEKGIVLDRDLFPDNLSFYIGNLSVLISADKENSISIAQQIKESCNIYIFIQEFIDNFRVEAVKYKDRFWETLKRDNQKSQHILNEIIDKRLIISAVLVIGTACNLKCKNCANMLPYAPHSTKKYKLENILKDIRLFAKNVDYIPTLIIQGGEPFLHKELDVIIREIASMDKIGRIEIATNGTFIPRKEMFDVLKACGVVVRISDYKTINNSRANELEILCTENGIQSFRYEFFAGVSEWAELGNLDMDCASDDVAFERFRSCTFQSKVTIQDGEVSHCSRNPTAYMIQGFERAEGDVVVLNPSDSELRDELRDYIVKPHFMTACKYCNGNLNGKRCIPAEQLEEKEWKSVLKERNNKL